MSIKPGATYIPVASTTCFADDAGMAFATRAIFPSLMATSIFASMEFLGSIT